MAARGAVANVQPSFVPTDARFVVERLPPAAHPVSYCWRSLLEAGVWVCGGSDEPVELPEPLLGIFDAMTRLERPRGGGPRDRLFDGAPFLPRERLPFAAALWMYTIGAAYAADAFESPATAADTDAASPGQQPQQQPQQRRLRLGALAPGFQADFVVVDRNVATAASDQPRSLLEARVEETWVAGKRRFSAPPPASLSSSAAGAATVMTTDPMAPGKNGPTRLFGGGAATSRNALMAMPGGFVVIGRNGCPCRRS